jgi:hypothetical protein
LFIGLTLLGGFACDLIFIALTRQFLRWAGRMSSSLKVATVVLVNLLLALVLVSPLIFDKPHAAGLLQVVAASNAFDVALFVLLALMFLIHRALWPLMTRTLFRIQDIGTKGRRAILTTIGFALLAAGVTGKVPELLQKLIERLGG